MAAGDAGACLLVDVAPAERAALAGLTGCRVLPGDELAAALAGADVDVVVIGSGAATPVALAQHAHRVAPGAGIAVLTTGDTDEAVRRQLGYAPDVPLEVLVLGPGEPLADCVATLREQAAGRRRHAAVLRELSTQATRTDVQPQQHLLGVGVLLEHAPVGVLLSEMSGELLGWNRRAETLLALGTASRGTPVDEVLPGAGALVRALPGTVADASTSAAQVPSPVELTARGEVDVEASAVASELEDGRQVALLLLVDVTARRAAERDRDRLAGHVELLAGVSEVLSGTLDATQAVELLAQAVVPALADVASVQVADESGELDVVTVHHRDPTLSSSAANIRRRRSRVGWSPVAQRALRGEAVLLPELTPADLPEHVGDGEIAVAFTKMGVSGLVAVPLPGRDDVVGALLLAAVGDARRLGPADLTIAIEVARRAGIALDNARLYARQRRLATELQRSLLTDPPDAGHAQIAVRYVAAAEQAQVGGDWYDAFLEPDGGTVVVIGDVVGHDTRATAAMGQLRGLLRGIAYTTSADPAEVLARVDAAIEGLALGTTATAVVACLEQDDADRAQGLTRLTWSNAGHPPPIVVNVDGTVDVLATTATGEPDPEADLLLGIDPRTPRRTSRALLRAGATVLLYTDGLVERRGQSLDAGIERLVELLSGSGHLPLEALCDTALRRLLPEEPDDDVALVAVRLHPQPQRGPAPPAAEGPGRVAGDETTLPATPTSVAEARRFTVEACRRHGLEQVCETAALLVSELTTNALLHGTGDVRVRVRVQGTRLRVEVTDEDPAGPAPREADELADGGRGLTLVDALADDWGWQPAAPGKTVWFSLRA